jgi:hypothetical protein
MMAANRATLEVYAARAMADPSLHAERAVVYLSRTGQDLRL